MRLRGRAARKRGRAIAPSGLALLLLVGGGAPALAADESGLSPQVISLPSGPGSIEGLGPSFEPQLNTGAASYAVPFEVPPGVAGLQPELAVTYNGGKGNGVFGLGWDLGLPAVERQTDKGQPSYTSDDVFVFGGEELVELAESPVSWRCENETGFKRFRRVGEGWEVTERSGRKLVFGHTDGAPRPLRVGRQADGAVWVAAENPGFDATFRWYLASIEDTNGNRIEYHYASFPDSPGRLYLASVRYADDGAGSYNEVTLAYQTTQRPDAWSHWRAGFEIRTTRLPEILRTWSLGALAHEYRLGYDEDPSEVLDPLGEGARALRVSLLTSITQHDRIAGDASVHLPPLRFGYTRLHLADVNNAPSSFPGPEDADLDGDGVVDPLGAVSAEVEDVPYLDFSNGNSDLLDVNGDGLPDLFETTSQGHYWYRNLGNGQIDPQRREIARNPSLGPIPLSDPSTRLADADGDGRVDLVRILGGGGGRWVDVHQIEIAADGSAAWVFTGRDEGIPVVMPGFDTPNAQVFDVDFDKSIDLVRMGTSVLPGQGTLWTSCTREAEGDANFAPFSVFPGPEDVDEDGDGERDSHPWSCAAAGTLNLPSWIGVSSYRFADLNGDRIQDVLFAASTAVGGVRYLSYWPGMGGARFAPEVPLWTEAEDGQLSRDFPVGVSDTPENLRLADVTGDGRADLVRVKNGLLYLWINLGGDRFTTRIELGGAPIWTGSAPEVRFADFDGNGSTDLVLSKPGWLHWVDFAPLVRPNLLRIVDNGIGLRTTIHYASSTQLYVDAGGPRGAGEDGFPNPWTQTTPFPMQVVSRVDTSSGLDLDATPGAESYRIDYRYRDPYYDPVEHEFRGFAFVKKVEVGDATAPTRVTRTFFHTGAPDGIDNDGDSLVDERSVRGGAEDEPLKGRVLSAEVTREPPGGETGEGDGQPAPDARLFSRQSDSWRIRRIHGPAPGGGSRGIPTLDEREVSFAFSEQTLTDVVELGLGTPHALETLREYDDFGNETRLEERGSQSIAGDERITTREFVHEVDDWIVDRVFRSVVEDAQGGRVGETLVYYDGQAFVGLALGQITNGNITRTSAWEQNDGSDRYIDTARHQRDAYGNVTATLDPLGMPGGNAHRSETTWHPLLHNLPVRETRFVDGGSPPLQIDATYDTGLGLVTSFLDFNGHETIYVHDDFGRLLDVFRPGDTLPTESYRYRLADPQRFRIYDYQGDDMVILTGQPPTPSSVASARREISGQSGVLNVITYRDGRGRALGTWTEDEGGLWSVSSTSRFNAHGGVAEIFQPYRVAASGYAMPGQGDRTELFYDELGREIRRLHPPDLAGTRREILHSFQPLSEATTDEEGHTQTTLSDGLGRLAEVHEDNEGEIYVTRYGYNAANSLVRVTDAQQNVLHVEYDGLQRRVFINDPDRGMTDFVYDDASNLREKLDAKGQRTVMDYDGVNRLLSEDYIDEGLEFSAGRSPDVAYSYDVPQGAVDLGNGTTGVPQNTLGFLTGVSDLAGEVHISYDTRGRTEWAVRQLADPNTGVATSFKLETKFDSMDRLQELVYPDADRIEHFYDARGLLDRITGGPSGSVVEDIDYRASGQVEYVAYGNGTRTNHGYDPRLRRTSIRTYRASEPASPLVAYDYTFDGASNVERIDDLRPATIPTGDPRRNTQILGYDDVYRLTSVQYSFNAPGTAYRNDGTIVYDHDRIGNLRSKTSTLPHTVGGLPVTNLGNLEYGGSSGGASGRDGRGSGDPPGPHAVTAVGATQEVVGYDANGNVTSLEGRTLTWDFENRLVSIEDATMEARYIYDFEDRRAIKRVTYKDSPGSPAPRPPQVTLYPNRYFEIRGNGQPVKYVYQGETRVARVLGQLDPTAELTQRVSLRSGWNLFATAVALSDAHEQLVEASPLALSAWRWDPAEAVFSELQPGVSLAAGSVVWVKAAANGVLPLRGVPISALGSVPISAGSSFIPLPGFGWSLPLAEALPPEVVQAWVFDAESQSWKVYFSGALAGASDTPERLGPGGVLFVRSTAAGELEVPDPAHRLRYYHQDHLGSSSAISDAGGRLVDETANYPFGHPRLRYRPPDVSLSFQEPYQFTQKELDAETNLLYLEARYLSGRLGRFLSVDLAEPVLENPQTLNRYSYVLDNPFRHVDPSGLYEIDFHFYTVYYLMRARGFEAENARLIAGYSQGVDDNRSTEPLFTSSSRRARFHFAGSGPETATRRNEPGARAAVTQAFQAIEGGLDRREAHRVGTALHLYADSWSHEGFTAWHNSELNRRTGSLSRPNVGHADAAEGGHAPDRPYNDPGRALDAARHIYDLSPKGSRSVPWSTVESDLRGAFTPRRAESADRVGALQEVIRRRFGDEVTYDEAEFDSAP